MATPTAPVPRTIDELLTTQKDALGDEPVLAYPDQDSNYVYYTLRDLDSLASNAAAQYAEVIPPRKSSSEEPRLVALLGFSDIAYVITMLAVSKLGHAVLLLSPRLALPAYRHLLTQTDCLSLIYQPNRSAIAREIQTELPEVDVQPIVGLPTMKQSAVGNGIAFSRTGLDLDLEKEKTAWIFHSSGSTGMPKPVRLSHRSALENYRRDIDRLNMCSFLTLPLFHTHGISTLFRAFFTGKTVYMYSSSLPITTKNLITAMRDIPLEIFCAVPYALKLLSESTEGLQMLRGFRLVTYGGSSCPKQLGDVLTEQGVNLVSVYGM